MTTPNVLYFPTVVTVFAPSSAPDATFSLAEALRLLRIGWWRGPLRYRIVPDAALGIIAIQAP